ncbi:MAG: BPL-N domain-containing protein, partial [Thermodesulfovibrionales bacterium]|nr:BPL-N domain-containing protein [Thermodesulfovibrionales bacterium]
NGQLKNYKMLFVPGGWASNKLKTLGECGINEVKKFVNNGGNYLGFCGGAGLATLDGIGLLNIKRMPTKERVPSFSGRIHLNIKGHPIFTHPPIYPFTPIFNAWWPSQFSIEDKNIKKLAAYGDALPDSFSSDLNVGDVEANGGWAELENIYNINLDPGRLLNEPAVVEGTYGKGKAILSLIHFDTPDDANGAVVLRSLWEYLAGLKPEQGMQNKKHRIKNIENNENQSLCSMLYALCQDLIALGIRNFLWFWRNPMLLQWRRGVRGLEYCTLYVMIRELSAVSHQLSAGDKEKLHKIKKLLMPFTEKAKQLLILERHAMQNGHITYERCDDPGIQKIRTELFGNSKSHGGLFKELINDVDDVLYSLIKQR